MAQIVPIGIAFCASAKSPDLLEPAMIPVGRVNTHQITNLYTTMTLEHYAFRFC